MRRRTPIARGRPGRAWQRAIAAAAAAACMLALGVGGCAGGPAAPAAYKAANEARLNAVAPWLEQYGAEHPERRQRVSDVLASWRVEVGAQRGAAAAVATRPPAEPPG
jgi:hypothetical protein